MEEIALTGKLELCVGEGSAKGKPFLKELTTTNINGEKKMEWATTCREQLKKAAEINERKRRHCQPRVFSGSPDLNIPINDTNTAKHLPSIKRSLILQVDNR